MRRQDSGWLPGSLRLGTYALIPALGQPPLGWLVWERSLGCLAFGRHALAFGYTRRRNG